MPERALVSVIIPAYNAEAYIERALKSISNQTYNNIEIIVVDDGSTDDTARIVKSFTDSRIRYLYQENQWLGAARNTGIKISKGEYICFLDVDDFYLPHKTEKQVRFLEENAQYDIVYCPAFHFYSDNLSQLIRKKAKVYPCGNIFDDLLKCSMINPNTPMLRRTIIDSGIIFWDGKEKYPEDWDFFLRIAREGFRFGIINEELVVVEIRENSLTTEWAEQWIYRENIIVMLENLFSKMSPLQHKLHRKDALIKKYKLQLAITYLISGRNPEFFELIAHLYPTIIVYSLRLFISLVPSFILKSWLVRLWKWKQRLSFCVVRKSDPVYEQLPAFIPLLKKNVDRP